MSDSTPRGIVFAVARVTLELRAPMTIGTGRGSDLVDSVCVADSNGVPTIPGSSLAGVLRAALWNPGEAARLFGFQKSDQGATSRVEVSWAHAHGADDQPVSAAPRAGLASADPVLTFLRAGVVRDHVRLDERGVVDRAGKFDRALVPKGARFTFELLVHGDEVRSARADLDRLLGLFGAGSVRLGAKSRSGLGEVTLARVLCRSFDLRRPDDRRAWAALPRALHVAPRGLEPWVHPGGKPAAQLELQLVAQDLWLFGTGRAVRPEHRTRDSGQEKAHDKVPVTERSIVWSGNRGSVLGEEEGEVLVPASGVKGALRHRALFHARRRDRAWAEGGVEPGRAEEAIDRVFGAMKSAKEGGGGQRGRLLVSEARLSPREARSVPIHHVSLDRFTQAPMDGLLFSEAPVSGGSIALRLSLAPGLPAGDPGVEALLDALEDLAAGRLALGAGSSRGHGYFEAVPPVTRDSLISSLGLRP